MKNQTTYLQVVDEHLSEAIRQHVLGVLGRTVTDARHVTLALEASTHSVVDTLWLSPVQLDEVIGWCGGGGREEND